MSRSGKLRSGDGHLLESGESRRDGMQRCGRVHADGCVPKRIMRRSQPRHVHGERPVPRRWNLRLSDGHLLESSESGRLCVQRRQRLLADRRLPERLMRWSQPRHVHGERPVSRRRHVRYRDGHLLESGKSRRCFVQRRQCMHRDRCVPERKLRWRIAGRLYRARSMSRSGELRSSDGRLLESHEVRRQRVQRRGCVHADG